MHDVNALVDAYHICMNTKIVFCTEGRLHVIMKGVRGKGKKKEWNIIQTRYTESSEGKRSY